MSQDDIFRGLRVGTPCHMKFDDLEGDGAKRWCGACRLHVYDFAQLTRPEVLRLVETTEGRLCGRIVRRPDGTVMTKDCGPVRQRRRRLGTAAAALLAGAAPFGLAGCAQDADPVPATPAQTDPGPEVPEMLGEVWVPEEAAVPGASTPSGAEPGLEELGDIAIEPAELQPLIPEVEHDPRERLGRIALPPREPEKPADEPD